MAAVTQSKYTGPPSSGSWALGDTVTDASSTVWECVFPGPNSQWTVQSTATASGAVDAAVALVSAVAGTVTASKAVIVDASKDVSVFRNVGVINLDAGSSGVAGSVDIFPATALSGKTTITSSDNTGDTITTITVAAQAGAKTLTVPDPGASASFVMTEGTQTVAGAKTFSSAVLNTASVGTAGTGVTAVEHGDGRHHVTVLTLVTTLPAIAGGANLGVGKLIYTFPAGVQVINSAHMGVGVTQTEDFINADTPDVGLGTVIASGAIALLGGTATFEDIITGQLATNCTGTATVAATIPTANVPMIRLAGDAKTVHLNVADGWAASGDAAALVTGTVTLEWSTLA